MNLEYWFIKTWWQQAAECRWERFRNFSFVCCNFWFIFLFIIFIFCNLIGSSPSADEQGFNSVCFISFLCIRCFVFNFFFFFFKKFIISGFSGERSTTSGAALSAASQCGHLRQRKRSGSGWEILEREKRLERERNEKMIWDERWDEIRKMREREMSWD
jgi:hypothetical protein